MGRPALDRASWVVLAASPSGAFGSRLGPRGTDFDNPFVLDASLRDPLPPPPPPWVERARATASPATWGGLGLAPVSQSPGPLAVRTRPEDRPGAGLSPARARARALTHADALLADSLNIPSVRRRARAEADRAPSAAVAAAEARLALAISSFALARRTRALSAQTAAASLPLRALLRDLPMAADSRRRVPPTKDPWRAWSSSAVPRARAISADTAPLERPTRPVATTGNREPVRLVAPETEANSPATCLSAAAGHSVAAPVHPSTQRSPSRSCALPVPTPAVGTPPSDRRRRGLSDEQGLPFRPTAVAPRTGTALAAVMDCVVEVRTPISSAERNPAGVNTNMSPRNKTEPVSQLVDRPEPSERPRPRTPPPTGTLLPAGLRSVFEPPGGSDEIAEAAIAAVEAARRDADMRMRRSAEARRAYEATLEGAASSRIPVSRATLRFDGGAAAAGLRGAAAESARRRIAERRIQARSDQKNRAVHPEATGGTYRGELHGHSLRPSLRP